MTVSRMRKRDSPGCVLVYDINYSTALRRGATMSDSEQFSHDLFLSYGWADIQNPDVGDRGWVGEFKRQLEIELTGILGRRARIFLDVEQGHNGELEPSLRTAL